MPKKRQKKQEQEAHEGGPRSLGDLLFRREPKAPESIEDALGRPKGPFDGPGTMTGWREGPDGRLIPYLIRLPEE